MMPIAPPPVPSPAADPSTRPSKASAVPALVVAIGLLAYTLLLGNPFVSQTVLEGQVNDGSLVWPAVVTFPKWDVVPASPTERGPQILSDSYWPSTNGIAALRTLNPENRWADWIIQNLRTGMLVALAPVLALVSLRSSSGRRSWLQTLIGCWWAIIVSGAVVGVVGNVVYRLAGGETLERGTLDPLVAGAGFGAQFGVTVGLLLAVAAATIGSSRS